MDTEPRAELPRYTVQRNFGRPVGQLLNTTIELVSTDAPLVGRNPGVPLRLGYAAQCD